MKHAHKLVVALLIFSTLSILASGLTSAYYYDDYNDYKRVYTVKESYDYDGYKYTEKRVDQSPWGKTVTTKVVRDYDHYRPVYRNKAYNYWDYGVTGYSTTSRYVDYSWNDARNRAYYGSQYHPYYYAPSWNGNYYSW